MTNPWRWAALPTNPDTNPGFIGTLHRDGGCHSGRGWVLRLATRWEREHGDHCQAVACKAAERRSTT